ncbi:hypothetical protein Tco_1191300 [Tanacetum coccineum]
MLRISAFMHGHGHPELAKKLNDKMPNIVDDMFKRVIAFIRGEAASGSTEVAMAPQWDKGVTRPGWSGGQERARGRGGLREFQRNMGTSSGKLAYLVKDIRRGNQRNGSQGRGGMKVINMVGSGGNRKRPYEMERPGLTEEIAFSVIPQSSLTDAPIILKGTIEGYNVRRIYVDGGSSSEIMYEHYFKSFDAGVKSRLRKANAPLVRTRMRSLGAVGSTIYSMIKLPTTGGVTTMRTSKEALIREQAILRARSILNQKLIKEPMITEETWEEDTLKEKAIIHNDRPDQHVCINKKLSVECKQKLVDTLRRNAYVFAWTVMVSTTVPRFIMEHQLQAYLLAEPVIHKKRPLTPDRRKVLKDKVFEWLREGIIVTPSNLSMQRNVEYSKALHYWVNSTRSENDY